MPSVEFTKDNVMKCMCGGCPVQAESDCVKSKGGNVVALFEQGTPEPADVPGVYCSTGKAACDDLDFSKQCICPGCPVYAENGLGNWKYCQNGDAGHIG